MVNAPMGREKTPMNGMDEILEVPGAGRKCVRILVEGVYFFWFSSFFKNVSSYLFDFSNPAYFDFYAYVSPAWYGKE